MKALILTAALLGTALTASAQVSVNGYLRNDGTYVAPHVRSNPNGYQFDNYGARGNTNPYTGQRGTAPSELYPSAPRTPTFPSYQAPRGYGSQYGNPYSR